MLPKQVANILLKIGAVAISPDKPFTYASGIKSPIYCDNRLLISHPKERNEIIVGFVDLIKMNDLDCDVIAGTATAGISWAAWIADRLNKPMIYIRNSAKGHGKQNKIEGELIKGQKVIVIEDLISSGGSSIAAIEAIQESGNDVSACVAIFSYQMPAAKEAFSRLDIHLFTLSNFTDLIELASEQGLINDKQMHAVFEWNKDPNNWGKSK